MNDPSSKSFDDRNLLLQLAEDDEAVFTLLYQKYWPLLMRVAASFIDDNDTCKEIVQELFVALYKKRARLKIKISLSSYLYASIRNRIRNHIRHQSVYNKIIRDVKRKHTASTANNVEQFVNKSELEREIYVCLNDMPVKCRQVYLLYQQNRCPLKNIAALLDRPVDTVEKQFRKAVHLLRIHLNQRQIGV
ncbi:MAG TPA: sigma-70 family RNA polymerase sigma factor [Puia sp.]|jgi:RNA polymerase sigma-70 factor (ECF subfamily)